jgi:hypothetical protein
MNESTMHLFKQSVWKLVVNIDQLVYKFVIIVMQKELTVKRVGLSASQSHDDCVICWLLSLRRAYESETESYD